jgi:hypothetical protein
MNKYRRALIDIASYEVPPADSSCCYRIQGAVYDIKGIAEAALSKQRSGGLHPPTTTARQLCRRLWIWIVGKASVRVCVNVVRKCGNLLKL